MVLRGFCECGRGMNDGVSVSVGLCAWCRGHYSHIAAAVSSRRRRIAELERRERALREDVDHRSIELQQAMSALPQEGAYGAESVRRVMDAAYEHDRAIVAHSRVKNMLAAARASAA